MRGVIQMRDLYNRRRHHPPCNVISCVHWDSGCILNPNQSFDNFCPYVVGYNIKQEINENKSTKSSRDT